MTAVGMSRKCKELTVKEKLDIIGKGEENTRKKHVDLTHELGLPVSKSNTVIAKCYEIPKNIGILGTNVKQTSAQPGKMEENLVAWFKGVRSVGVNVNGKVLCETADEIALSFGTEDFQALAA